MDLVGIDKLALGTVLLVAVEVAIFEVAVVAAGDVPTYVIVAPVEVAEAVAAEDCCDRILAIVVPCP